MLIWANSDNSGIKEAMLIESDSTKDMLRVFYAHNRQNLGMDSILTRR